VVLGGAVRKSTKKAASLEILGTLPVAAVAVGVAVVVGVTML